MSQRILIIDDDLLVAKSVQILLKRQGFETELAHNAVEAVTLAAIKEFDLVVSDVRMPGENGIVAIEKIKKIYSEKRIICGFILISGYAEEDTPAHAIRLGVDKFLYKPFDNEEFLKSVREELEIVRKEKEFRSKPIASILIRKKDKGPIHPRRVVITGIGCVSPNGIGRELYWKGLREGMNCVSEITSFDTSTFPAKFGAEIKNFDPKDFVDDFHEVKRMGRSAHLAVAASKLAVQDSKLSLLQDKKIGVLLGSATSGLDYAEPEIRALERGGVRRVRPFAGIAGFGGAISGEVSRALGLTGISITFSNGCTSATDALGYALKQIRFGLSDIILAGGADACVMPAIVAAFCQMGAISTHNHNKASRPFNKDRNGFVIAEGSWMFVLEELNSALDRKAKIYAELVGYGATCDAWHMSKPHPSGDGTSGAIIAALEDADLQPEEIDVFEAYGNATPVNDSYETGIIKKVFGQHAYKLLVPSVKSMLGHPIGAAGGQQLAAALLALNEGFIHPTINYEVPDPECDLDYVPNVGREGKFQTAVCNSLAFGGKNASIVVKNFED